MSRVPSVRARLLRRAGLDRNPLRRAVDRVEAWTRLVVLAVLVVGGPILAWSTGWHVYRHDAAAERVEESQRSATQAVLVTDAPYPTGNYATVVLPTATAHARWSTRSGTVHSGVIEVPAGTRAGTAVTVWTDATGTPVLRPRQNSNPRTHAFFTGLGVVLGTATLLAAGWWVLRRILDRYRLDAWHVAWSAIGPQWTGWN